MSSTFLAFCADLHIANHRSQGGPWKGGINRRGQHTIDALGNACSIAESHDAERIVLLGDVFDTTKPEPQLITGAQRMLNDHCLAKRIIKGNHDEESSEEGDHAVGPLGELKDVEVYEQPFLETLEYNDMVQMPRIEVLYVPFETGPAKKWLPQRIADLAARCHPDSTRILCLHLGLHDQKLRDEVFWAEKADDAISAEVLAGECYKHKIRAAFAGNWHGRNVMEFAYPPHPKHGLDEVTLVQVGTLTPTGWDNAGLKGFGGVALAEIEHDGKFKLSFAEVPGPRFLNVSSDEELEAQSIAGKGNQLYVRWTCKPQDVTHARFALDDAKAFGKIEDYNIRIDKVDVQAQARSAAAAAQSTTTMQAVLEAFVTKMPIPTGIDRERVYNRSKGYLE